MQQEQIAIVQRNVSDLIEAEYNPRQISEKQFGQLKDSLKRFGFVDPVLVNMHPDRQNIIIGGHMRTKAAAALGHTEVPVVELNLSLEQEKELNIRLNKSGGSFDFDMLANLFEKEDLLDWGFEEYEFGVDEVTELPPAEEGEVNLDPPKEPITVLGDLYELNGHRLHCADSTDSDAVAKLMDGKLADMVFTDPPYGVDYEGINNDSRSGLQELLEGAFSNYSLFTKEGGSVYCFHSDRCADIFHEVFRAYCHFSSMVIWVKPSLVLSQTDYQSQHEPCFYGWFSTGTHKWYGDRKQTSIWNFEAKRVEGHTTPKPLDLIANALANSSQNGHLITDLFLGSGSTLLACEQTNRTCYGQELGPNYCDVIVRRWVKYMQDNNRPYTVKRNGEILTNEEIERYTTT